MKAGTFNIHVLILLSACLAGFAGIARGQGDVLVDADGFFDTTFGDLQEELETVRDEGKTALMVMFETPECPWCARMKKQVMNRAAVQSFYGEHFRCIALNAEGDLLVVDFDGNEVPEKEFALKSLRVRATPVFAFFNPQGELVARYTGALKNAQDFILLGEYVLEEKYLESSFTRFRRAHQSAPEARIQG